MGTHAYTRYIPATTRRNLIQTAENVNMRLFFICKPIAFSSLPTTNSRHRWFHPAHKTIPSPLPVCSGPRYRSPERLPNSRERGEGSSHGNVRDKRRSSRVMRGRSSRRGAAVAAPCQQRQQRQAGARSRHAAMVRVVSPTSRSKKGRCNRRTSASGGKNK